MLTTGALKSHAVLCQGVAQATRFSRSSAGISLIAGSGASICISRRCQSLDGATSGVESGTPVLQHAEGDSYGTVERRQMVG